jgi:hypothetical protein
MNDLPKKPMNDTLHRWVVLFELLVHLCIAHLQINLPNVQYEYFDFHNECRNMRWDRISVLIEKMKDDLDKQGFEAHKPLKEAI